MHGAKSVTADGFSFLLSPIIPWHWGTFEGFGGSEMARHVPLYNPKEQIVDGACAAGSHCLESVQGEKKPQKRQEPWKKICSIFQRSNEQMRWWSAVVCWSVQRKGMMKVCKITGDMEKAERGQLFPLLPQEIQGIKWCLWNKVLSIKIKDTISLWSPCQKLLRLLKV